jgi:hypothetical protein
MACWELIERSPPKPKAVAITSAPTDTALEIQDEVIRGCWMGIEIPFPCRCVGALVPDLGRSRSGILKILEWFFLNFHDAWAWFRFFSAARLDLGCIVPRTPRHRSMRTLKLCRTGSSMSHSNIFGNAGAHLSRYQTRLKEGRSIPQHQPYFAPDDRASIPGYLWSFPLLR